MVLILGLGVFMFLRFLRLVLRDNVDIKKKTENFPKKIWTGKKP
jgi:hypothetical protein